MRKDPPYRWGKVQPDRLNGRVFSSKKNKFGIGRHALSPHEGDMSCLSYYLEHWPACSNPWVNLLPQMSTSSIATGTKIHQKKRKNSFCLLNWRRKFLPVLGHILVLHPRLGRFSQKSKKNQRHFLRVIWGQKVLKNHKLFKWVTRIFHSQFFIFCSRLALYHCAKIHSLSSSNKLSTEVGVLLELRGKATCHGHRVDAQESPL